MESGIAELAAKVWERLEARLPKRLRASEGGRPWVDDYACLQGIAIVLKTGCRWKDIPSELGVSYTSCWRRHREWTRSGLLTAAWTDILKEVDRKAPNAIRESAADATFIRAKKGAKRSAKPSAARG